MDAGRGEADLATLIRFTLCAVNVLCPVAQHQQKLKAWQQVQHLLQILPSA